MSGTPPRPPQETGTRPAPPESPTWPSEGGKLIGIVIKLTSSVLTRWKIHLVHVIGLWFGTYDRVISRRHEDKRYKTQILIIVNLVSTDY